MEQTASLYDFTVTWAPFLLRPGIPMEGMEKPPEYKTVSKTGHLYKAGQSVGIEFTGKCPRFPNTLTGHAMLEYVKDLDSSRELQNDVQEKIFQAYFTDGFTPDRQLMDKIAEECGLDMAAYRQHMDNPDSIRKAEQQAMEWRSKVQTGVPFFLINNQPAFSGAQDTETFIKVFQKLSGKQQFGNL